MEHDNCIGYRSHAFNFLFPFFIDSRSAGIAGCLCSL